MPTHSTTDAHSLAVLLVLQLAIILLCARTLGFVFRRYLHTPAVLGELCAGMIIGPFALGALPIPGFGPLFPLQHGTLPISSELYGISAVASIVLLFVVGLHTDLTSFLRYSLAGTAVGVGGVGFSFILGDLCAVWFGIAPSMMHPTALFLGTVSTATSVGLTARILEERKKVDTPECVTILAGAVIDDVLCVVILAVTIGIARVSNEGGSVDWHAIAKLSAKVIIFWLVATVAAVMLAKRITRLLKVFRSNETLAALAFGLALLLAGISELAGLAMIIGAYIMGLALSRTDVALVIQEHLQPLYDIFVPIFFCTMGMLVDFASMRGVLVFGLVYTALAIVSKVAGCAIPARLMKFNATGALRIGLGMLPRGEVALIVAGIGLSTGSIPTDVFGAAIMMTVLSTVIAPPLLMRAFTDAPGIIPRKDDEDSASRKSYTFTLNDVDIADFLRERILQAFHNEEFYVHSLQTVDPTYQIRKEDMFYTLTQENETLTLTTGADDAHIARLIVLEELVTLQRMLESLQSLTTLSDMENNIASTLFDAD